MFRLLPIALLVIAGCSKPTAPTVTEVPDGSSALPIRRAEIIATLTARGFAFKPHHVPELPPAASAFLVEGTSIGLTFIERGEKLHGIALGMTRDGDHATGERSIDFIIAINRERAESIQGRGRNGDRTSHA